MSYVTPVQLAERPGAQELAQVATAAHRRIVDSALMEATLRGGDRSAWTTAERTEADDALARIQEAVVEAGSIIDGFLVQRGYSLPLTPVPPLVAGWARDIARYKLHKDRGGLEDRDPIARAYRDAMKLLQMTATGQFKLGGSDPIATDPNNLDVRFDSTPSVFNRDQLRRFR